MLPTVLHDHVLLLLGALWHLNRASSSAISFGLQSVISETQLQWEVPLTMVEVVQAKRWALENDLIDDRGVGYTINTLGEEYLRFKKPEYEPPPPPQADHFPPVKKFKHRRR